MDREEILKNHRYAIWQAKDGGWNTTLPDGSNIKRKTREALENAIVESYKPNLANKKNIKKIDELKEEIDSRLEKERLKKDFSEYKEINVWDIKKGAYLISPIGNVYSLSRKQWSIPQLNDATKTYPGQYYVYLMTNNSGIKRFSVARLVLATFIGLPSDDMKDPTVDHIDSYPLNNYYKNLRWLERGINSSARPNRGIGEMNSRAKLTQDDVIFICNALCKKLATVDGLAQKFSVSPATIQNIKDKKNWSYISQWFDFS